MVTITQKANDERRAEIYAAYLDRVRCCGEYGALAYVAKKYFFSRERARQIVNAEKEKEGMKDE